MSAITKSYRRQAFFWGLLSFLLNFGPLIGWGSYAMAVGEPHQTLALGGTVVIALVLSAVNFLMKYHLRSTMWILALGIWMCVQSVGGLLLTLAICTIVDELLVTPLRRSSRRKYAINKEIDKRGEE